MSNQKSNSGFKPTFTYNVRFYSCAEETEAAAEWAVEINHPSVFDGLWKLSFFPQQKDNQTFGRFGKVWFKSDIWIEGVFQSPNPNDADVWAALKKRLNQINPSDTLDEYVELTIVDEPYPIHFCYVTLKEKHKPKKKRKPKS